MEKVDKGRYQLYFETKLKKKLQRIAREESISLNQLIVRSLKEKFSPKRR